MVDATVLAEFDGHSGGWFGNVTKIRSGDVDVFFRTDSDLVKYSISEAKLLLVHADDKWHLDSALEVEILDSCW